MATEPPPLFDDSDKEEESAADPSIETAEAPNLFDVDLTKEDTPEPVSKDPLLQPLIQPPPVEEEIIKEDKPPVEPESVKPKSQPASFFDDSDSEDPPKEKPVAKQVTDDKPSDLFRADNAPSEHEKQAPAVEEEEEEEEEDEDAFDVQICVTNPEKVGEGMSAYIAYTIQTKTTIPGFKNPEASVRRRFSDFLGLHSRIVTKYAGKGIVIPPAPEKSTVGMAKIKFSKSEEGGADFIEKRRASLERYLMRTATHPKLRKDTDFINFLEDPNELPKAKETSAVSGAGFMRLVKNVGDSISKMTSKMSESDEWFEEKAGQYDAMEAHLKKLHKAIEAMTGHRKDLASTSTNLANSIATLANVEENASISKALSRLSEVEEKIHELHDKQVSKDTFVFGETVRDHINLIGAIKTAFNMRIKAFNTWTSAQNTLTKKREQETKLKVGGKPEKLTAVQLEVKEWEEKVEQGQKEFERISKTIKREVNQYEAKKATEFKNKIVIYLEAIMQLQQELIEQWEAYLPEAKAITA